MFFQTLLHLSRLHIMQLARLLSEIGAARIVILSIVLMIFISRFAPLINFQSLWAAAIVIPFMFAFTSLKGETPFFQTLDLSPRALKFARNILFSLPGIAILLVNASWTALLLAFAIILAGSFLPISGLWQVKNHAFAIRTNLLPWTVGLRNSVFILTLLLVFCFAGLFHMAFLFLAMFVFHFMILGFFQYNEPAHILESYRLRARPFLTFYSGRHLIYYSLAQVLFILIGSIIYTNLIPVFAWISSLFIIHQLLSVYLKFAFYEPGRSNERMQSIQTLMLVFLFIPFTAPIPFWYLWKYRKKALDNLNVYL